MKLLAVTACPSGVAHTYMAAEAIAKAAKAKGYECKVETQGSIGVENEITPAEVEACDAIILTNAMPIRNEERFTGKGKPIVRVGIGDAIKKTDAILKKIETHLAKK